MEQRLDQRLEQVSLVIASARVSAASQPHAQVLHQSHCALTIAQTRVLACLDVV